MSLVDVWKEFPFITNKYMHNPQWTKIMLMDTNFTGFSLSN